MTDCPYENKKKNLKEWKNRVFFIYGALPRTEQACNVTLLGRTFFSPGLFMYETFADVDEGRN